MHDYQKHLVGVLMGDELLLWGVEGGVGLGGVLMRRSKLVRRSDGWESVEFRLLFEMMLEGISPE